MEKAIAVFRHLCDYILMKAKEKRTMTLNLTEREMAALEALTVKKGLSKTATMRLALRLLQAVDAKVQLGHKLFVEDDRTREKSELVVL